MKKNDLKFILEQVVGARYKLFDKEFIKADKQLSAIQSYLEEQKDVLCNIGGIK